MFSKVLSNNSTVSSPRNRDLKLFTVKRDKKNVEWSDDDSTIVNSQFIRDIKMFYNEK